MRFIFIAIIISANLIYGTDGEHWLKLKNIPAEYDWVIEVTSYENEYYYDCAGDIVPKSTVLNFYFSKIVKDYPGDLIVSDFICDEQANEGTLDDFDNKFITYRGRHIVTVKILTRSQVVVKSVYCIWNFQDCSQTEDVYFYYDYLYNKIIESNNGYSLNYGDYSNAEFKIWEDLRDEPPKTRDTDCFIANFYAMNQYDSNPFGSVYVDNSEYFPTDLIQIDKGEHHFKTSDGLFNDAKFRIWSINNEIDRSTILLVVNNENVFAQWYNTHPLTVHNYLEGGSGGSYDLTWTTPDPEREQGTFQSLQSFNSFEYKEPYYDKYKATISQTIPGQYGTNWEFQYWDDGSTSLTRSNIAVSEPTTLKAYYKGVDKTDAANALTNNNQAKI